jgi:uncharacterized protein YllA (UPF0747 family)
MDFNEIFNNMFNSMKAVFKEDAPKIQKQLKYILENNKVKLERITNKLLNGQINQEQYEALLRRNMRKIEDQLSTVDLMKDKAIQDAVNAGIDVLMKAVKVL